MVSWHPDTNLVKGYHAISGHPNI